MTLTELRDVVDGADALRAEGVVLETGGHQAKTFATAELIVVSPCAAAPACIGNRPSARDRNHW